MHISKYNPVLNGNPLKDETVYPIKKKSNRLALKHYWLSSNLPTGRRNLMLFEFGLVTGLRASDLVRLTWKQVYQDGYPRCHIYGEKDKKTGKLNHFLDIKPLYHKLALYRSYYIHNIFEYPIYMFPVLYHPLQHIKSHTLYLIMRKAGEKVGLNHLGSHTIRKTSGYIAFKQTYNLGYVMKKLNQSNPSITLRYIGLERESMDRITNSIHWF